MEVIMGILFDLELARGRRDELLHEVEERRLARALRRFRRGEEDQRGVTRELHDVGWGLAEKESTASCHTT
jgi:hypothetical protein